MTKETDPVLPDPFVKVAQVLAEMRADVLFSFTNGHCEVIPDAVAAQEFLHALMKEGDWHLCHHKHPTPKEEYG